MPQGISYHVVSSERRIEVEGKGRRKVRPPLRLPLPFFRPRSCVAVTYSPNHSDWLHHQSLRRPREAKGKRAPRGRPAETRRPKEGASFGAAYRSSRWCCLDVLVILVVKSHLPLSSGTQAEAARRVAMSAEKRSELLQRALEHMCKNWTKRRVKGVAAGGP